METKLIFFDIDGTILDEHTHTVPLSATQAIIKAQQNGHQCFINTGRPRSTIDKVITDLPFDGFICGCGTYIEYHNQELFHTQLSDELRRLVIQSSFECSVEAVLEGKEGVYFPKEFHHRFIKEVKHLYELADFPVYTYSKDDHIMFDKYAAWYHDDSDIERYRQTLSPYFEIIQRDIDFLEIIPLNYSKATGIQYITDYLHNKHENTISIGDSTNDLSMLEFTKESVAMGNSNPLLFDIVTFITTDIQDNGIENALKHFNLI
ncbi:Cof-type HAD-IIB family hydrolase [Candidatus Stoquefichus massiliensis]|uniref:Cof-type HAD-IIB family hydrolase n=1 Tax=Candidatus Stoquefichus massiliensis TaxID=1470350 RepID=UPI00048517E0|nr:HAD family hydrolase [Candidatus Stoquefichus massiliensis]